MKLLTGQANSGKSETVFLRIAERLGKQQGNPILIAPSTNAADVLMKRLQPFLVHDRLITSRPVPVSFPALSQKILRAAGQEIYFLSEIQRNGLLRSVIAELAQEDALIYFDKTAGKPGLVHSLGKFINELWRSGIDADDFANIAHRQSKKDIDVALIFKQYEMALHQTTAIDAEGAVLTALRQLEAIDRGQVQGRERIIQNLKDNFPFLAADGFDFYTPVQVRILSQLSRFGIEVMATLTFEEERAVHLWQKRTHERFIAEGAEIIRCRGKVRNQISEAAAMLMSDTPVTRLHKTDGLSPETALQTSGREAEVGSDLRRENGAQVKVISAPDRASEVRAVAREIKRLVIEDRFALDDITIVCRSLDKYAHHFERVFTEGSIPLELDTQIELGENPLIVAILRLLRLSEKQFQRRAVLECLRSPYFDLSEFNLDEDSIDSLEHISLAEKITQTRDQWIEAIEHPTPERTLDPGKVFENPTDQELRASLASRLNQFFELLTHRPKAQRREYARAIAHLLTILKIGETLKQGGRSVFDETAKPANEAVRQAAAAQHSFLELLKSLGEEKAIPSATETSAARKSGDRSPSANPLIENQESENWITWKAFLVEVESAVAATCFQRIRSHSSVVVAQEAHNLRPRNYRAIFVVGLIEGEFPKKSTETTPYTLAEKDMLRTAGIDFAETSEDSGADVTQFHKAMTRARERFYLSHARSDFSGGELLKSYLIDEVITVAKTDAMRLAQTEKEAALTSSQDILSLEELAVLTARQMRKQAGRLENASHNQALKRSSAMLDSTLRSWPATMRGAVIEHRRLTGREQGIFGGVISDKRLAEKIKARFGEDYMWSASKINNYGICPFRFFVGNVLNLSHMEEPTVGFVADRLGSAYHEILEKTYRKLNEMGIELNVDSIEQATEIAENICEETLQRLLDQRMIRKSGLWDFERSEIKKRITNLLRFEALSENEQAVKPLAFEQRFGYGSRPPLVLENNEGEIKIRGCIDRIDKTEDGLVVIDYKTSRSPISAKEALEGRNLQMPIYLMAANRVLKRDQAASSGFYLHIYSGKRGSEFPNKNISVEEVTARAEAYIGEYVNKVRHAEFPVTPNQNRCPAYCEFDVMCRIQSLPANSDDE
jgi:ATP-dependent helicase/nuclease subunit B